MSNNNTDNIIFFLNEKECDKNNENEIEKMMMKLNEEIYSSEVDSYEMHFQESSSDELDYFIKKNLYGNDELFYDQEYTVKDLIKICRYYDLEKDIKISKYKKQDIIATLVYFESLPENLEIVKKRNRMWAYISELLNDPKLKKTFLFL